MWKKYLEWGVNISMNYKYKFTELDCASCANKIESKLKQDSNIINANVNFSKLTVTVETNMTDHVKDYIEKIVQQIEPDVYLLDLEEKQESKKISWTHVIRLIIGIVFAALGFLLKGNLSKVLIILSYIILLSKTFINAIKLLIKSKSINESLLITISCIGAYFTDNISEGLMVIILYEIGKVLEEMAIDHSRKSISSLMNIKPEYANLKKENQSVEVKPEMVHVGDIIIVKRGEKVPLDGTIIKGEANLNTSALTGESKLRKVKIGDEVLSGSINQEGLIELKVSNLYQNSTVSRILDLVETATDRKAKTETFVASAAKIYTPIVLILALLVAIIFPMIFSLSWNDSIQRALTFLVISCPCAIAISVPLSYFSGIGKASKEGILIKGSDYLDALGRIKKIIFDKTGTITTGEFNQYHLEVLDSNLKETEIIKLYVKGEKLSNHPIAKSILNHFPIDTTTDDVEDYKELAGKGIIYQYQNQIIKIGSSHFVGASEKDKDIYLSIDDNIVAKLNLLDGIKKEAPSVIQKLKQLGIQVKMFTGDSKEIALSIGDKVGIKDVSYHLLPDDKYQLLEKEIQTNTQKTAFVGDGINDAPSLALADVGISMGSIGSASAIEASDVVIMTDDLEKIVTSIQISKFTTHIVKQNLIFAMIVKIVVLLLSGLGVASMWQAVFADTGVTLLTILNTTRILKLHF